MVNKEYLKSVLVLLCCAGLSACTEPAETTGVGAAAGGVLGAGLGAIVGNQTGSPGSGLVIGAVAGASAGAAVGNALQAQEEAIRTQDEAIERQEKVIAAQKVELEALRRYRDSTMDSNRFSSSTYREPAGLGSVKSAARDADAQSIPAERAAFQSVTGDDGARGSLRWGGGQDEDVTGRPPSSAAGRLSERSIESNAPAARVHDTLSSECREGFQEALKGKSSSDISEKLFYYRRALRLCPNEAAFHNGLGEVYTGLNRKSDAAFEFGEAIKLDPSLEEARRNLAALGN